MSYLKLCAAAFLFVLIGYLGSKIFSSMFIDMIFAISYIVLISVFVGLNLKHKI